jgi:hypothetical protein
MAQATVRGDHQVFRSGEEGHITQLTCTENDASFHSIPSQNPYFSYFITFLSKGKDRRKIFRKKENRLGYSQDGAQRAEMKLKDFCQLLLQQQAIFLGAGTIDGKRPGEVQADHGDEAGAIDLLMSVADQNAEGHGGDQGHKGADLGKRL